MEQNVFILGATGNVGKELVEQIEKSDGTDKNKNPTKIIGLANSTKFSISESGTNIIDLLENGKKYGTLEELKDQIQKMGIEDVIFVDVTAGEDDLLKFHKDIITNTDYSIVTANKNPISLYSIEDYKILTGKYGRYGANTTVNGGAGSFNFIKERKSIHDTIKSIEGVFSGTLGYIMSELDNSNNSFSEIVSKAKKLGYTEPNPWDDLNGLDVARKLLILARNAGFEVKIEDVEIESLIPEKFGNYSQEEFMEKLKELDSDFKEKVKEAEKKGNVLRYVGEFKNLGNGQLELKTYLKEVPKSSEIGNLKGTKNIVVVETGILNGDNSHIIKSPGAGVELTAAAVRVDIAKMLTSGLSKY